MSSVTFTRDMHLKYEIWVSLNFAGAVSAKIRTHVLIILCQSPIFCCINILYAEIFQETVTIIYNDLNANSRLPFWNKTDISSVFQRTFAIFTKN